MPSGCSAGSSPTGTVPIFVRRRWDCPFARRGGGFFDPARLPGDYLHAFETRGRRVTRRDLDFDAWHDWQADMAHRLQTTIAFFYGNFVCGVRRAVIDGVEPVDRPSDSVQIELFEYIYHQILRKDSAWVARDLFREHYRACAEAVAAHAYDCEQIGACCSTRPTKGRWMP